MAWHLRRWPRGCARATSPNMPANPISWRPDSCCGAPSRPTAFNRLFFTGRRAPGKTSLAQIIARQTRSKFERLSGVESNVADMRRVLSAAANRLENKGQPTILFIDEIHRFNKAQQDVLLPDVESGVIRLIGATTHNPFFFVNSPLVSRSQIFELRPLSEQELYDLLQRALADAERGLGYMKIEADEAALRHLAKLSDGDARKALNSLEIAALTTSPGAEWRHPYHSRRRGTKHPDARRWFTTAMATRITTPFPPSSNRCAAAMWTRRFTGWPR